jgi:hypothetical protein
MGTGRHPYGNARYLVRSAGPIQHTVTGFVCASISPAPWEAGRVYDTQTETLSVPHRCNSISIYCLVTDPESSRCHALGLVFQKERFIASPVTSGPQPWTVVGYHHRVTYRWVTCLLPTRFCLSLGSNSNHGGCVPAWDSQGPLLHLPSNF